MAGREARAGAVRRGGGTGRQTVTAACTATDTGVRDRRPAPAALSDALAYKFGYRDTDPAAPVARYAAEAGPSITYTLIHVVSQSGRVHVLDEYDPAAGG